VDQCEGPKGGAGAAGADDADVFGFAGQEAQEFRWLRPEFDAMPDARKADGNSACYN